MDIDALLADEEYLSQAWNLNGAQGRVCCFKCSNVSSARSGLVSENIVDVSCSQPNRFRGRTDEEAWGPHALLEELATAVKNTPFKNMQTMTGSKYHPKDLLAARRLKRFIRPVNITTYDYVHALCTSKRTQIFVGKRGIDIHASDARAISELRNNA